MTDDVPYLRHPPSVINVDVGRQLFVDDFLVEELKGGVIENVTPLFSAPLADIH
jgi:hypothetical protein